MHQNNIPVLLRSPALSVPTRRHFVFQSSVSMFHMMIGWLILARTVLFLLPPGSLTSAGASPVTAGHGLVTAVNLVADLGCVQLIQIFMFICMVCQFHGHCYAFSLSQPDKTVPCRLPQRRWPCRYAASRLSIILFPHRRIRTIVKRQRHHRFGGIDVASSAGYHSLPPAVLALPAAAPAGLSAPAALVAVPAGLSAPAAVPAGLSAPVAVPAGLSAPAAVPAGLSAPARPPALSPLPCCSPQSLYRTPDRKARPHKMLQALTQS